MSTFLVVLWFVQFQNYKRHCTIISYCGIEYIVLIEATKERKWLQSFKELIWQRTQFTLLEPSITFSLSLYQSNFGRSSVGSWEAEKSESSKHVDKDNLIRCNIFLSFLLWFFLFLCNYLYKIAVCVTLL